MQAPKIDDQRLTNPLNGTGVRPVRHRCLASDFVRAKNRTLDSERRSAKNATSSTRSGRRIALSPERCTCSVDIMFTSSFPKWLPSTSGAVYEKTFAAPTYSIIPVWWWEMNGSELLLIHNVSVSCFWPIQLSPLDILPTQIWWSSVSNIGSSDCLRFAECWYRVPYLLFWACSYSRGRTLPFSMQRHKKERLGKGR